MGTKVKAVAEHIIRAVKDTKVRQALIEVNRSLKSLKTKEGK